MTSPAAATAEMDRLDQLGAKAFDGFLVRKDLVRKYSRQYPVPTYVVEFLLGRYCASTDPSEIEEGLQIVEAGVPSSGVNPPAPPPRGIAGVGRAPQRTSPAAGLARGGQVRFPGSSTTSTRRTMPKSYDASLDLASLLDGSSAGGVRWSQSSPTMACSS
ncbi:MAG: anti-phage BREX system Lon protease BrxL [Cyanobium sp.]